jgi:hypothetical protein
MTEQTVLKWTTTKPPHATGYELLHNPRVNKGTAYTEDERDDGVSSVFCRRP